MCVPISVSHHFFHSPTPPLSLSLPSSFDFPSLSPQGLMSGVVVAMDWGAYKHLVNRGVPAVLVPTKQHLDVCCLRRFRMVPWRSTNDVKV